MPLLAALITSLFTSLATFFAGFVAKKVAMGAAAVATFATLTAAMFAAISALAAGVAYAFPSWPFVSLALWIAVPDNTSACVAAIASCDALASVYRWNVQNLKLVATVS